MSVYSKMTAVADAIRSKTGGTDVLTLDQMATAIDGIASLNSTIIEFPQMNDKVTEYLAAADAEYTDDNSSEVSVMESYQTATDDKDRPLGYPLTAINGNLYVQNEENGNGWKLSVGTEEIKSDVFNTVPGKVVQYIVKDADGTLLENGRIKPTGKVRMIRFDGYIRNCRDLGGWACDGGAVQYGKLFRSAVVDYKTTDVDSEIGRILGIRHHIDLRSESVGKTESCLGANVKYMSAPITLYYANSINSEKEDYETVKSVFRTIFDAVAHDEPTIYHCSLGRDRTGTITFMVLGLLGVTIADIDKDYELSSFSGFDPTTLYSALRTRSEYQAMKTYLATLGGQTLRDNIVWWFIKAGFTLAEINAFRVAMTDGTPDELAEKDFVEKVYTNLLPLAIGTDGEIYDADDGTPGYKSGVRLSSSGADSAATGYDTTGFIPCKLGDIVRMQGINYSHSAATPGNHRICFFMADKSYICLSQANIDASRPDNVLEGVYDGNNKLIQFAVKSFSIYDLSDVAYFRICGDTFDDGAIITVNEEITG